MKNFAASALATLAATVFSVAAAEDLDARAAAIVANMTSDQVLGQMTQYIVNLLLDYTNQSEFSEENTRTLAKLGVGSYLLTPFATAAMDGKEGWTIAEWREFIADVQAVNMEESGIPMLYGIDSVNGANSMLGATFFPHQINTGATFNPDLAHEVGRITAQDTVAAGVPWIFGPILDISRSQLWPRVYETFGEDPLLVATMGNAVIRGMQANNVTAACMKHFIAYSKTPSGHDKDAVTITDFELLNEFLLPYLHAMDAGAKTVMESYSSTNGIPNVMNSKLLKKLLRDDMGFDGLTVSDMTEFQSTNTFHRTSRDLADAYRFVLERSSVDMSMGYTSDMLVYGKQALENNPELLSRLQESAQRIIKLKLELGLFDNPVPGAEFVDLVRNANDTAVSLQVAQESIVLLQNNDSTLPLSPSASVFLTGFNADDIGAQCGGWTIHQQGVSGNSLFPNGTSVLDGMTAIAGSNVTFFNGLSVNSTFIAANLSLAKEHATNAEYTVVVVGERPYTEKIGDLDDLAISAGQVEYINELASTGTKIILVLIQGRPRLLGSLPESVHAVINAMLPCEHGGQAIAEIIYGQVNPSGRLPITYPKDPANVNIPYNHNVATLCADSTNCEMQWDFGAGLSYTSFDYSAVTLSTTNVTSSYQSIDVSVDVTNSGSVAGKETVMLFLTQPYRSYFEPKVKELKKFSKIYLEAGETTKVTFTLTADDWSVYYPQIGRGLKKVAEDTDYVIAIKPETDCDVYNSTATAANPLCATFSLNTSEYPYGSIVLE